MLGTGEELTHGRENIFNRFPRGGELLLEEGRNGAKQGFYPVPNVREIADNVVPNPFNRVPRAGEVTRKDALDG